MWRIKSFYKFFSSRFQTVHLEFKVDLKPRLNPSNPSFRRLKEIVDTERDNYSSLLTSFLKYSQNLHEIPFHSDPKTESAPYWNNKFLPGLDVVGLYGMLAEYKPSLYLEIGSGNSTMVARKCIKEQGLQTQIISIDPHPRASIDHLADRVIRRAVENTEGLRELISQLKKGDILFIDNSHRLLPNSDVFVCFLEILPELAPGVIVHVHDIYIPYDYPEFMCDRLYNEQYVLMAFMIANPTWFRILLPNFYISEDPDLSNILSEFWNHPNVKDAERHGGSFWFEMNHR